MGLSQRGYPKKIEWFKMFKMSLSPPMDGFENLVPHSLRWILIISSMKVVFFPGSVPFSQPDRHDFCGSPCTKPWQVFHRLATLGSPEANWGTLFWWLIVLLCSNHQKDRISLESGNFFWKTYENIICMPFWKHFSSLWKILFWVAIVNNWDWDDSH